MLIENVWQLEGLDIGMLKKRQEPKGLIMCSPEGFQVHEVHNYFMRGNITKVEQTTAMRDWQTLHDTLARMTNVKVVRGESDCPDMIFAANAALTVRFPDSPKVALMSRMVYPSRRKETLPYEAYLRSQGYEIITLPEEVFYEGLGDSLWHPGRALLWGGGGRRSLPESYTRIADLLDVPVILLQLVSELYHLDTCFCPIDERTALFCPAAFTPQSTAMIERMFTSAIAVEKELGMTFACNAVILGKRVVLPQGAEAVHGALERAGLTPTFVPMHEMMKSGGAVRCCTLDDY